MDAFKASIPRDLSTLTLLMRASVATSDSAMQGQLLSDFEATEGPGEGFVGQALKGAAQRGDVRAAARLLDLLQERRVACDVTHFNRALQAAAVCL